MENIIKTTIYIIALMVSFIVVALDINTGANVIFSIVTLMFVGLTILQTISPPKASKKSKANKEK